MTSAAYMAGRKKYARPQAMLWADSPGTLEDGIYIPNDYEVNAANSGTLGNQFLILSDDNREPIEFQVERIEKRERMINGRMRSYHIADKLSISTSWQMLPSRSFALAPDFDENGVADLVTSTDNDNNPATPNKLVKPYGSAYYADQQYTTDGGAGGAEILDWYENHQGSFWVFLAYDKYTTFGRNDSAYAHLPHYNQIIEMFFSDFSYSVEKRGNSTHDFWNISVTLEEV